MDQPGQPGELVKSFEESLSVQLRFEVELAVDVDVPATPDGCSYSKASQIDRQKLVGGEVAGGGKRLLQAGLQLSEREERVGTL